MDGELTQEYLKSILDWDDELGVFRWKEDRGKGKIKKGDIAGCINRYKKDVYSVHINGKGHSLKKVSHIYHFGFPPSGILFFADGDGENFRPENLSYSAHNEYRIKKAYYKNKKWWAYISYKGIHYDIGHFDTEDEAEEAILYEKRKLIAGDLSFVRQREEEKENRKKNKKFLTGVYLRKDTGRYVAQIVLNKKKFAIGGYATEQEAHEAYLQAKENIKKHGTLKPELDVF
jgi:hypothetical protein